MTFDQKIVEKPAAALGYLIFAAAIAVNPILWPLGYLIAARASIDNCGEK